MQTYLRRWRALWDPNMYHGWGKQHQYFEGWYFKLVDPTENQVFAIIPGISKGENGNDHAFIQVLDGVKCQAYYHEFSAAEFQPSGERFALQLGNNFFSAEEIQLDLPELKGRLSLNNLTPWPKMLGAPGIMGWYSFVPFMECYHGVVSLHHQLKGSLEVYGSPTDFTNGIGYGEKDWGVSFPSSWIWMQTNHFDSEEPICFMASVARIPWLGSHFIGYIVGFYYQGQLYRYATYTGAKMKAILHEESVELAFKDSKTELRITAHKAAGGDLVSPLSGKMTGKVNESMQARVNLEFYKSNKLVFSGNGKNAGLEVAGPVEELLTSNWRR